MKSSGKGRICSEPTPTIVLSTGAVLSPLSSQVSSEVDKKAGTRTRNVPVKSSIYPRNCNE